MADSVGYEGCCSGSRRLNGHGKYTTNPGGPTSEVNPVTLRLKVSGKRIKGAFSLSALIYYEGQTRTLSERCHTGKIHFTGRR